MRNKKLLFFFILCVVSIVIYVNFLIKVRMPVVADTDILYCKEVARQINRLGLKNYECFKISEENEVIIFHFRNIDSSSYEYDEARANDVLATKNYLIEYLQVHPESVLNERKIELVFRANAENKPPENVHMFNFDCENNADCVLSKDFSYYSYTVEDYEEYFTNDDELIHFLN